MIRRPSAWLAFALSVATLLACTAPDSPPRDAPRVKQAQSAQDGERAPATESAEPSLPAVERPLVVFLGDSLTAGYGVDEAQAFPAVVARRLAESGSPAKIVNAGVSGDTTAGGLARLDWVLRQEPDVLVVGLGANDGLRGLDLDEAERNLRAVVSRAQESGVLVLLLGMRMPPSHGADYAQRFAAMYEAVARDLGVASVPFLLEGVGGVAELNLADGIHPTPRGHEVLAENVTPYLEEILREVSH